MQSENQNSMYETLLNTIPDPVFIISEEGIYLEVLGGVERALYDDVRSLKGKSIYTFMEKNFAEFFMDQVRKALEANVLHCFEYQLCNDQILGIEKNGPQGIQWFEARLNPLEDIYAGKRAVFALIINITDRKVLQQRLQDLSYQDSLTGISNRRFFIERLTGDLAIHRSVQTPIAVLLFDIDHFKDVNDTYGHLAGDFILKELVPVVGTHLRKSDLLARFGGEEFVVSCIGMNNKQALGLAERMREAVETHLFQFLDNTIHITISIGITQVNMYDFDVPNVIGRADKAMYKAKKEGRNRVVSG